jgi:glycosyltransferase involved in cell wall biosynthesis
MTYQLRRRIIFLIDSLRMGGAERLLPIYLEHFDTDSFELRVCALDIRDGNPLAHDIEKLNIPVDLVQVPHLRDLSAIPRLSRYLREQQADLIHTQLEFADTLGSLAAKFVGIPTVSTLHTFENPRKGSRTYWRLKLRWWMLEHLCSRVIAVSEGTRQHYINRGDLSPNKIITLYNGIDLSRFNGLTETIRQTYRHALAIPAEAPVLITVAVLRQPKGIQYLIEALPAIIQAVPAIRCLVVGSGSYEDQLKALVSQLGLTDYVIFTGTRTDIPELMATGDVFVLPTLGEALPTVLAEAMAAYKPIVVSNVGGVPEMIEHGYNGLLVDPANPSRLAEACLQLLQNPVLAQAMSQAGRKVVEQKFNIRIQAQRLSELYRQILAERGK